MNYGPQAAFRVALEKHIAGLVTSAAQIVKFFEDTISVNAGRATRNEAPLEYEDLLQRWDHLHSSNSATNQASLAATFAHIQRELNDLKSTRKSLKTDEDNKSNKRKKVGNSGYCPDFNSVAGCSNPASGPGRCVRPDGQIKKHGCNVMKQGKHCNDSKHNRHKHTG